MSDASKEKGFSSGVVFVFWKCIVVLESYETKSIDLLPLIKRESIYLFQLHRLTFWSRFITVERVDISSDEKPDDPIQESKDSAPGWAEEGTLRRVFVCLSVCPSVSLLRQKSWWSTIQESKDSAPGWAEEDKLRRVTVFLYVSLSVCLSVCLSVSHLW